MKLLVKNKFFSMSGGSEVTNEQGELVYKITGNVFSNLFGFHKKTVRDTKGNKIFYVRNKFWHVPFHKSVIIYNANKEKLAVVSTSSFIKNNYEVEGTSKPIKVEGFGWNLNIFYDDKQIGKISLPQIKSVKDALRVVDAYVLDVFEEEDASFLTAMMIAIDNIHDTKRRELRKG